jgi:hypothetical protein
MVEFTISGIDSVRAAFTEIGRNVSIQRQLNYAANKGNLGLPNAA